MKKEYLAIVIGDWDNEQNRICAPLKKNQLKSGERHVNVDPDGKISETRFTCLKRFGDYSLIKAMPLSGRTHQIRVHARHAGCPLLGDEKYSLNDTNDPLLAELNIRTFLLHAHKLSFTTPDNEEIITFEASIPPLFDRVIESLSRKKPLESQKISRKQN